MEPAPGLSRADRGAGPIAPATTPGGSNLATPLPGHPLSLRRTLPLAAAVLALTLAALGWNLETSVSRLAGTSARHLRLERLLATLRSLGQERALAVHMAASTGDLRWNRRHPVLEAPLASTLRELRVLAPDAGVGADLHRTESTLKAVGELERRALALVRDGASEAALGLVEGEYDRERKSLALAIEKLDQALDQAVARSIDGESRRVSVVLVLSAALSAAFVLYLLVAVRLVARRSSALRGLHQDMVRQGVELEERKRAEADALAELRRRQAQQEAIAAADASAAFVGGDVAQLAREITELAARVTGVERANVWLFDLTEAELRCIDLFEATPGRHSAGTVLAEAQFANEFAVLKRARYVDADDALTDPRTAGYVESYLVPLRISAMLDAVIRASGRNLGLLCLEHVDRPHRWQRDEVEFACQLADKIALALVNRDRVAALDSLRESEARHRALIEEASDLIYGATADGRISFLNPAAVRALAVAEPEVLGRPFTELVHPSQREQVSRFYLRQVKRRTPSTYLEILAQRGDGESLWLGQNVQLLSDPEQGDLLVAIARDITARKRAEDALAASEEKFRGIVESTTDWVWAVDQRGHFTYSNPALRDILGYSPEEVLGRLSLELMHEGDRQILESTLPARVPAGHGWSRAVVRWRHRDGSWRFLEGSALPILDGADLLVGWRGIARDVTSRRRLEAELELQAAVVRNMHEGVCLVRMDDATIVYANPKFEQMFGYDPGAMVGLPVSAVNHDDGTGQAERRAREILGEVERSGAAEYEVENVRRDGSRFFCRSRTSLLTHPDHGRIAVAVQEDISERKASEEALRESERRFQALTDAMPQIAWAARPDGWHDYFNQRWTEYSGLTLDESMGSAWARAVHPGDGAQVLERWQRSLAVGEALEVECRLRRFDGAYRWHLIRAVPLRAADGNLRRWFGTSTDIEDQRVARELAEGANRAKSEFLANMSHEIRTPLNGILGITDLLLATPTTREQGDFLQLVRESADQLLTVINDILDFSKIEAGRMELEPQPFALRASLGQMARALSVSAAAKGLSLRLDVAPEVPDHLRGDEGRLRQVVINLVSNAIKFTAEGEVAIEVALESREGEAAVLHAVVRDQGIGIAPDRLEAIFSPFVQADGSTTRRYGGSGLGLSVSSQLVALMGGQLWVESSLGHGSAFHFTVRLGLGEGPVPSLEAPVAAEPVPPGRPLRVLLAEDNAINRRLVIALLERRGHAVTVAVDGREAVARAAAEDFDVALVDVQMPELDGFQATAAIRAAEQGTSRHLPIVALTAHALKSDREACLAAGMDDYLSKPIRTAELLATLERWASAGASAAPPAIAPGPEGATTFDAAALQARTEGDRALLAEIVDMFRVDSPIMLAELRQCLEQRNVRGVEKAAHALKGCVSNLGAPAAAQAALAVEQLARDGALDEAGAGLADLEREIGLLGRALDRLLAEVTE